MRRNLATPVLLVSLFLAGALLQSRAPSAAEAAISADVAGLCVAASSCHKAIFDGVSCENPPQQIQCTDGYTCDPSFPCNAETYPGHPNPHELCCRPPIE